MKLLQDAQMYARFAAGLRRYFRQHLTLADAERILQERIAQRNENFLRLAARAIYGYEASPYRALLVNAGCELGDLRACIEKEGLEPTLQQLRAAGVYVTFEEFKGRAPLVRDGKILAHSARAFDNPFLAKHFVTETSGSTGQATRIAHDLEHQASTSSHHLVARAAHNLLDAPFAIWRGILPDGSGINNILHTAPFDRAPQKWFSHFAWRESNLPLQQVLFSYWFVLVGKMVGASIPFPRYTPLERADVVAQWVFDTVRTQGSALLGTQVSRALRVGLAAQEKNLDLSGATFMVAGEPPTPAKVNAMRASGAHVFPTYGMAEVGRLAMGCANPLDTNDTHFLHDAFALIAHESPVHGFDITVPAFHLTTLLATTPKIMLNVIGDDYGVIEERACDCLWHELGYTTHLREIHSVNKLTGEGVTLIGTEMVNLLEQVLPSRFGGSPLDYQLQEQEDAQGFTRLALLISPRVVIPDEAQVVQVVLNALSESSLSGHMTRVSWETANALHIERAEPVWTARGKLMPLHLQRRKPQAD
jgi:hypothetical protein